MITATLRRRQASLWQRQLAEAITDPAELLQALALDPAWLPAARAAAALFPLRVPRGFVARMNKGDPNDPLLRQVLPLGEETAATPGFATDPLDERRTLAAAGVLHKYQGRALLITTGACAVHCRYCFRREFPYAEAGAGHWRAALDYLAADAGLREVILSGGDPLVLANRRLRDLTQALGRIAHLERLRIHSRLPIVLPARVDTGLLEVLATTRFRTVLVVHANHPREIDHTVADALQRLIGAGITLFNQAVLLKGVNDSAAVLAELSEALFRAGVIPYYLHLLDRVQGAGHFEVEERRAAAIMEDVRSRLPGYLVPRLVREQAGRPAKTPVA